MIYPSRKLVGSLAVFVTLSLICAARCYFLYPMYEMECKSSSGVLASFFGGPIIFIRNLAISMTRKYLPSPHSELLLGMTIGVDEFETLPKFKEALITTGTVHVVVVSGFNINLVSSFVLKALGSKYKLRSYLTCVVVTLLYAVLCGFEPPVVRAWIFSSIFGLGTYYGRVLNAAKLLVFTGLVMVAFGPCNLFSLSFQLSFAASLSLILFAKFVENLFSNQFGSFFLQDLGTTISAQVLVFPIISHYFGRVNLFSPLVNGLVLWTIPVSTLLGMVFLILGGFSPFVTRVLALIVYTFLDYFVGFINYFSKLEILNVPFTMNNYHLVAYYLVVLIFYLKFIRGGGKEK